MISGSRRTKSAKKIVVVSRKKTAKYAFEVEKNRKWVKPSTKSEDFPQKSGFFFASFDQKFRKNAKNGLKSEKKK